MHENGCENKAEYVPRSPNISLYGGHFGVTMSNPNSSSNGGTDAHDDDGRAPEESPLLPPTQSGRRPSHLQHLLDIIDEALIVVGNNGFHEVGGVSLSSFAHQCQETMNDVHKEEGNERKNYAPRNESTRVLGLTTNEVHEEYEFDLASSCEPAIDET